jgi:hypothetical protein
MNLDLLIDELPSKTIDQQGKVIESFNGGKMTIRTTVRWQVDSWTVEQALLVTT